MIDNKPNILCVDDEERVLRSLKMLFRGKYNVWTTTDGFDAIEIVKSRKIHAIISDQRMPIMLGVDLLREVKRLSPNTMRLLLTGYSEVDAIISSVNEGEIYRYINKPWSNEEIRHTVETAVELALEMERTPVNASDKAKPVSKKILVLDNDNETREKLRQILGVEYRVKFSADFDEALEILSVSSVDLLITDIKTNTASITASLIALKKISPGIVTIVTTSFKDTTLLVSLINQGQIFRFLPKPLSKNLLKKSIEAGLCYSEKLKLNPQLLKRHHVELKDTEHKITNKIVAYLNKLRNKGSDNRLIKMP